MADDNPLLKALPPAVDYLSYLTILEYNLNAEQLPILHQVLQDTTLTANIGWDLVHLLLPLLPESQTCLQDVARLGNPREVVLKVTELLEGLTTADTDEGQKENEEQEEEVRNYAEQVAKTPAEESPVPRPTPSQCDVPMAVSSQGAQTKPREPPSKVSQFCALLEMLAILHPRIKTRYPSRFLSTSLQSVLPAYATFLVDDLATEAMLTFIKAFAGSKRPRLPPRKSSTQVLVQPEQALASAPDPEANAGPLAPEEIALQQRLLQSFLTFAAEGYTSSLHSDEDEVVAMSWSSRLQEHLHPDKSIPGRRTMREAFEEDENLHRRDSIMGQMLALARDLNLQPFDLLKALTETESLTPSNIIDLPSSPSDVPLSGPGCLHLLNATIASTIFFHARSTIPRLSIFPTFSSTLSNLLGEPSSGNVGSESLALIDSLLFLGSYTFETFGFGEPPDDDAIFTNALQRLSLLSANTPSAPLRYHAHVLTSQLLHAHPNESLRLSFIKDTLQHCPYENLKASAVGWLKDEILAANTAPPSPNSASSERKDQNNSAKSSIFTTPSCVVTLVHQLLVYSRNLSDEEFLAHRPFFLAALNLHYLLLTSATLRETVGVDFVDEKLGYAWLVEMDNRLGRFKQEEKYKAEEGDEAATALLEGVLAMCKEKHTEVCL